MALKATIFKASVHLSDLDRHYYQHLKLTLAQHPSETEERMMARLLAYLFHADEKLTFAKGLSSDEEPDLWQKNYHDDIELWIELGTPSFERLRKASHKAQKVVVYTYQHSAEVWWEKEARKLKTLDNLNIISLAPTSIASLTAWVQRTMELQCTIQDGALWLTCGESSSTIEPATLLSDSLH